MKEQNTDQQEPKLQAQDTQKLTYVMLVVLIICGGNGLGILTAAVLWKITGAVLAAILVAVGITVLAFIGALGLILSHNKKPK